MSSVIHPRGKIRSFCQGFFLSLVAVVLFFGLLEGGLFLFGVEPELRNEDPFVGFVSNVPLFVEKSGTDGRPIMVTADNKRTFFNFQQFPLEKAEGTRRIFCLGGSTTYGRPYDDTTSFAGWLRELLPAADPDTRWEVINAGGVSYASYRVAKLMQELVRYEPDLFIIYSGHNEFLEERTYGALRDIPAPVRTTAALLARTRTWSAMSSLLDQAGALPRKERAERVQLTEEVKTILDRSIGPDAYRRDTRLREQILLHYRTSLERMVDMARSAGAQVLFVTPASNLRDSSPFKSQHGDGLNEADRLRVVGLLAEARGLMRQSEWAKALQLLERALALDSRYAALHYQRGRSLFELQQYAEADLAFRRARDEDVCPLRAVSPMQAVVTEVAREKDAMLVDFIDLLEGRVLAERGCRSPGKDYFLDHVHPTIEGNRILAVSLVNTLVEQGLVQPVDGWGEEMIDRVAARVEGGLDRQAHVSALVKLAKVLGWAGKTDEAGRLARKALASGNKDPEFVLEAAEIIASLAMVRQEYEEAGKYYRMALEAAPSNPIIHYKVGMLHQQQGNFEKAAAHILLASAYLKKDDVVYQKLGAIMVERGRFDLAYPSLEKALQLNPRNRKAEALLARMGDNTDLSAVAVKKLPKVLVTKHPSGAPKVVVQVSRDNGGRSVKHGIYTEWYRDGLLKGFVDYVQGVPHGTEKLWSRDGKLVSKTELRRGRVIEQ